MNWKIFFKTVGMMWGTFLFYKLVTLSLLYLIPNLQSKPYYELIYFLIVLGISCLILYWTKKLFHIKINLTPTIDHLRQNIFIFIIPFILYGIDFIGFLPSVFNQSLYLIVISIVGALGAGIFEEIRDRGLGTIGFSKSIPETKWKPLIIATCTSLLFCTTHYLNLLMPIPPTFEAVQQQVFYTFFLGMVLSVLTIRTGTVFYSILFHFMNNLAPWTPMSNLATVSPWGSLLVIYGLVPLIYALWCLRPNKMIEMHDYN